MRMIAERWLSWRGGWMAGPLVAFGGAASAYLLLRTFALIAPGAHASPDVCSTLFASSCDGALTDERSWVLGIPLAGWGLVHFIAIGVLLGLARFVEGPFETQALIAASALATVGTGAGIALVLGAWFQGMPVCPICLSIHATNLGLMVVLQRTVARPLRAQLALVRGIWAGLLRRGGPAIEQARWSFVGFGCVALVMAASWQWVWVESVLRRPPSTTPLERARAVSAFVAAPEIVLPVSAGDAHRGPLDAPVRLVVFESLQCPHCQRFAPVLSRLETEFGNRLLVVFKHYPLSTRCNERLHVDIQPDACELAWAAVAAQRQSRFWEFHDALLAAGTHADSAGIENAARGAGLEPARFEADRRSPEVRERVAEDIELGNQLKLPGTPAIYLDGRLVRASSAELLEALIRHELASHGTPSAPAGPAARESGPPDPGRRPRSSG